MNVEEFGETHYEITGFVQKGYESVCELFEDYFRDDKEENAQLCVYVGDKKVIDIVGRRCNTNYSEDSLQYIFSSSKTVCAIVMGILVDRGLIKYEDKVSKHWPEFARNGKENIRISEVLSHESGCPWVHHSFEISELTAESIARGSISKIIEDEPFRRLEDILQTPMRDYHVMTQGFICNEIMRRVDPKRRTMGSFIKDELRNTFGVDVFLGEDLKNVEDRIATLTVKSPVQMIQRSVWTVTPLTFLSSLWSTFSSMVDSAKLFVLAKLGTFKAMKAFMTLMIRKPCFKIPGMTEAFMRSRDFRFTEVPSANIMASARGLAKLAAFMSNQGHLDDTSETLIGRDTWSEMHSDDVRKPDIVFGGLRTEFTQGGVNRFRLHPDDVQMERRFKQVREGFYGWVGFGGSCFQWNPDLRDFQFSFTHTRSPSFVDKPCSFPTRFSFFLSFPKSIF